MTQDFVEDAIEACNREKVPFVFAMRTGNEGDWLVNYNLSHHNTSRESKEEEVKMVSLQNSATEGAISSGGVLGDQTQPRASYPRG